MSDPKQATFDEIAATPVEVLPARRRMGRPIGTKGKFRSTLDKALRARWHEALAQLMAGVMVRDPTCTRIYWERVMPAPKRMAIELSTADNKPLRIESPADARAAMSEVLSLVAAGELASDEADELITCYGKYLAASSIHTLDAAAGEAIAGEDPQKIFADRLARIMAAKAAPAPDSEPAAAPAAPEMTEDELAERVLEAVARKLEGS